MLRTDMSRLRWALLAAILAVGIATIAAMPAQTQTGVGRPPGTNYQSPSFTFNKIADGVYHAVGTRSLVVTSNADIVEGNRDIHGEAQTSGEDDRLALAGCELSEHSQCLACLRAARWQSEINEKRDT
jgi:hypothetical protein